MRAKRNQWQEEETLPLEQVLEPYDGQPVYQAEPGYQDEMYQEPVYQDDYDPQGQLYQQVDYQPYPEAGYADYLPEEAYDEEMGEPETRFGVAIHVFNLISSLIGIVVILVLVAMLLTLVDWLRTDILHSFMLFQSGIN